MHKHYISIWFFIGTLLFIYGVIILGANIFESPESAARSQIVLKELNFGTWWGVLLIVIGLFYFIRFRPWRENNEQD
jgi:hypothetical protein